MTDDTDATTTKIPTLREMVAGDSAAETEVLRVLYIEDDPIMAGLFERYIGGSGWYVGVAADGRAGLRMAQDDGPFDVVAVDYMLPDMTGTDVAKALLAHDPMRPVIMVTARGSEQVAAEAMAIGVTAYVIKDADAGFLSSMPDILRRMSARARSLRMAEEVNNSVRRSETYLRGILDNSPNSIFIKDMEGRYILANRRFRELNGIKDLGFLGKTAHAITSGEQLEEHLREDAAVIAAGHVLSWEKSVTEPSGAIRRVWVTKYPIHDEAGVMFGIGSVAVDVTERAAMEQRLRQTAEAAEAASRAKSVFLANMSHELRTPLNSILGFSEVLRSEMFGPLGSPHYGEYLKDIQTSGQYLLGVISDILDLSRIEAGRLAMKESVVDVAGIIGDAIRLAGDTSLANHAELTVDLPPDLPKLRADGRQVTQALLNLIGNAIKFTSETGAIAVTAYSDDQDRITIEVRDNGIGIPESALQTILQPFSQVADSHTRSHAGAGLGLSIARLLMKAHGGELVIESVAREGTRAMLVLPAARMVRS